MAQPTSTSASDDPGLESAVEAIIAAEHARNEKGEDAPADEEVPAGGENAEIEGEEEPEAKAEGEESEDADEAPAATPNKFKVTVDGETAEVTQDELIAGYQRQADYTRKTQSLAEERRSFHGERDRYIGERRQVADRVGPLVEAAISILKGEEQAVESLREVDPGQYAARKLDLEQRRQQMTQLEYERQQLVAKSEAEERAALQAKIPAEREKLKGAFKGSYGKDFDAAYKKTGEYALSHGFTAETWNGLIDAPLIQMVEKARLYDEAAAKVGSSTKKLAGLPKVARPGAARGPGDAEASRIQKINDQFRKAPSVESAADLLIAQERARSRALRQGRRP